MFKDKNGNYRLKIAFDFDGTLTEGLFYILANHLITKGHDVWIMTARTESNDEYIAQCKRFRIPPEKNALERNNDIYEMATELGIRDKIIFTNLEDKSKAFQDHQFDILFDDDAEWHCNPVCEAGGMAVNI
ncbi:MAG: hypothetical protein LBE79_08870 [Tannerella sp.]|jgi:phosphoserine phosphatase|nr:hypothetical protein [Tannerella sp.]